MNSTLSLWTGRFLIKGVCSLCFIIITMFVLESPVFNENGVDSDQTPRSVASDLGLHCL